MPPTITIREVRVEYENHAYRSPLKFGGVITDKVTILNASVRVENGAGKSMTGFGSMPLGNVWSFPSREHTYDETLAAMKRLAEEIQRITLNFSDAAHPVDINVALEPDYLRAAEAVGRELNLRDPIPPLCTLVVASPFDAALHDAYGKLHGVSAYATYGPSFMSRDLAAYLDERFTGEWLQQYISPTPKPTLPLYHLVGAVDPLTEIDVVQPLNDGLPETLPQWIERDGLTHLKIKLNGDDLDWDVDRVTRIDRLAEETQSKRAVSEWFYSLDFNERCQSVEYLLDFLRLVQERAPNAMRRVQYIEQPTARDLKAHPENTMRKAAEIKPVVIDESLVDYETLLLARDLGYTGVALKACKGQTQAMLMAAAAQKFDMFLCVQDLTCPGASFLHSAGVAAHVPPVAAIESNGRQYCPAANAGWLDRFPTLFTVANGRIDTSVLNGPGLGVTEPER